MGASRSSPFEILLIFLQLGCVCFGGPVAHLGFFREEFVKRRQWLDDADYADLVALCQFLPGPASSQVGFALGLRRGGWGGGMAAWIGFTLPSAGLMIGFALGLAALGSVADAGWVTGLKLTAVAVVAHALWGMAVKLCPDWPCRTIAILAGGLLLATTGPAWQVGVILLGALGGRLWFREARGRARPTAGPAARTRGWPWLGIFLGGLVVLPLLAQQAPEGLLVLDGFYRAGSLVFGGGHVVLPLLDAITVRQGWISPDVFLAGYGVAQALPGPLFTFTAFLGSSISVGPGGVTGGILALVAIYVPSLLLILGVMPYWDRLRQAPGAQAALKGTNAAVVGLLAAALIHPIGWQSLTSPLRAAFAVGALALLRYARIPPWMLVAAGALVGWLVF